MKILSIGNIVLFIGGSNVTAGNPKEPEDVGRGIGFALLRAKSSKAKYSLIQALVESNRKPAPSSDAQKSKEK